MIGTLKWILRNRAITPWYLVRYWRLLKLRIRQPHIVVHGMVFLDRNVEIACTRGMAQMVIGSGAHIGAHTAIRCHEGSLQIGENAVFGQYVTVNAWLDVEIGADVLFADQVYVCDFDHDTRDRTRAIKDQGILKTPVRIGPDSWLGTKVTVLRGTRIGQGCVIGANSVARGEIPPWSIAVGTPAQVVRER